MEFGFWEPTEKTRQDWIDEASSYAYEFEFATGRKPTLEDVIKDARSIDDIEDAEAYATELFKYISELED